ncbi:MAG: hypothetical protein SPLM_05740 [Spiroplasma phoeniceum]|uniref:hypothetical protein n=1 Tax=Spiroplasma phoeniceum TaxID=47835 RepID=UPI003291CB6E
MIRLILLVVAIAIFGTGFITVIINQLTSAKNIIMDLYNSDTWLLSIFGKMVILFSHPLMLTIQVYILLVLLFQKHYIVRSKFMKSNVENKKEKKQNGLFISWIDLILYLIISCLLAFVCVLDTVSTIEELKEKYAGINGYIIYGLWFDILWCILIIHYFYCYLFNEIIKLIKENRKNKLVDNNA